MKRLLLTLLVLSAACLFSSAAPAQIKRPGAHPRYSLEIEPHVVLQWEHEVWNDAGLGPGVRFNIPFLDNGPIDRINNNMAIGFGVDWAHFGDDCDHFGGPFPGQPVESDCSGDVFVLPVTLQWNFFITPRIWVFGEPGLAIGHSRWRVSYRYACGPQGCPCAPGECDGEVDDTDTDLWFVFWGGARFLLSDRVSFTARIGTPYVSLGASFLM
ncbi:MAG TPA: hypothetical protein VK524_04475 [Polyangiaceae bacterium]|nr:hypothetical protein [Polyangiaceae bacterium]